MISISTIGFDADDTLWESEIHYVTTKHAFAGMLSHYAPVEQVEAALDATEIRNVGFYGYGFNSFTLSMVETAIQVSAGRVQAAEIDRVLQLSKQALVAELKLIEDVEAVLEELSARYPLLLITKGELFEQRKKVERSGLGKYFRRIEVVHDKTEQTYRQILLEQNLSPEQFLMVGNSLRSDILPVVAQGGWAVYIPNETTWSHEHVPLDEIPSSGQWFELARLSELPGWLRQFRG